MQVLCLHSNYERGGFFFWMAGGKAPLLNYLHDKIVKLPTSAILSLTAYSRGIT